MLESMRPKGLPCAFAHITAGALAFAIFGARSAGAQGPVAGATQPPGAAASAANTESLIRPPPPAHAFIQYGVAFTVEGVASPGPICSDQNVPCILGSGGGISVRVGWRPTEDLYIGGAYELSKQDPNKLYRLGILQQARAEARRYFPVGLTTTPFVLLTVGLAGYGDTWGIDTWGPSAAVGGGLEVELSGGIVLGASLVYRPIYLKSFTDSSTLPHQAGIAHMVGLELALEAQDTL
jgi:hypothetical protein